MRFLVSVLFSLSATLSFAQCLTDFTKLVPEPSVDAASGFGNSVSMYDNYLAVGVPYHDSVGRAAGLVYIYEFVGGTWNKIAALAPSDPADGIRFGITIKLTQDYLLVGSQRNGGKVYLFKKSAPGWVNGTELTSFSYPVTSYYGIHSSRCLSMSDDQQTIAIADPFYRNASMPFSSTGAIFIYHKNPVNEWNGSITPAVLIAPEEHCDDFGAAGISMMGDRLVTATPYAATGVGRVYVFRDPSPGYQNLTLEAKLDPGVPDPFDSYISPFASLAQTPEGIFVTGTVGLQTSAKLGILFFAMPVSGTWSNTTTPTCYIEPKINGSIKNKLSVNITSNGSELFASVQDVDGNGYAHVIRKDAVNGWCSPVYEVIDQNPPPPSYLSNNYGGVFAVNQTATKAVIGFLPHPENTNFMSALRVLNKNGVAWENQPVYFKKKSTAGHFYGSKMIGFDDYLFVGAPHDGTVKANAGAVYSYKKVGSAWQKTGKILPPLGQNQYDDVFGSAVASNKNYLAIGAIGHEPKGKIFMYKKSSPDWSSVSLVQEITIPEAGLVVYLYGDNLAMDDNWLVVPYLQNSPIGILLAFFKFNGTTWDFKQVVNTGAANFFSKETTMAVAIHDGIVVCGGRILELNQDGLWEIKHTLSPSDPEPIQISPDFTHWVSNGALFGHSVAIHDNAIFIGAPMRDYNGTWDVGAVYVYVKGPNESWSSRTETAKLVPRVKDENELFGYSVSALFNTLIVGAPGNDYNKDGVTPRNKPGRSYVFQSQDYYWQDVIPFIDFTGESFEKDYYGISVYLDETDFFMGASIEDIETADLSGAVYVTPTPPIIKLVPPVCQSGGLVDLFGYPFGGTWSGQGIVNAAEGIVDPTVLTPGFHTFTYVSASCAFPGTLKIQIDPPVHAVLQTNSPVLVCTGLSFSKSLSVQPQNNCQYQWYFKAPTSGVFIELPLGINSSINVSQRGQYQVKVYNTTCSELSPIISVQDEVIDLQLPPMNPVCNSSSEPVTLTATPAGGQWSGTGVVNNTLIPKLLAAGTHVLAYRLTSTNGCIFAKPLQVVAVQGFDPVVEHQSGQLCEDGTAVLVVKNIPADAEITWFEKGAGDSYTNIQEGTTTLTVDRNGSYKVNVKASVCEVTSLPFVLNSSLQLTMSPEGNDFEVCSDDVLTLSFEDKPGTSYEWYFAEDKSGLQERLAQHEHAMDANKTGYYTAVVTRGVCVFTSLPKYVLMLPSDSVSVPNVFTPNGDKVNDIFYVDTSLDDTALDVFNRNGKKIFSGLGNPGWNGGEAPTGVYYWTVSYLDCHNTRKFLKGWVHLLR